MFSRSALWATRHNGQIPLRSACRSQAVTTLGGERRSIA